MSHGNTDASQWNCSRSSLRCTTRRRTTGAGSMVSSELAGLSKDLEGFFQLSRLLVDIGNIVQRTQDGLNPDPRIAGFRGFTLPEMPSNLEGLFERFENSPSFPNPIPRLFHVLMDPHLETVIPTAQSFLPQAIFWAFWSP